jgi:hypothetical protein
LPDAAALAHHQPFAGGWKKDYVIYVCTYPTAVSIDKVWRIPMMLIITWYALLLAPSGDVCPKGWTLSPRGNVHPPFTSTGVNTLYYLEEWRVQQIVFTPRGQLHPCQSQSSPLGAGLKSGLRRRYEGVNTNTIRRRQYKYDTNVSIQMILTQIRSVEIFELATLAHVAVSTPETIQASSM